MASDLVETTNADLLRDAIAEQLAYAATQIACARMFVDISDDAGLLYAMDASKAHLRAALQSGVMLRKLRAAAVPVKAVAA